MIHAIIFTLSSYFQVLLCAFHKPNETFSQARVIYRTWSLLSCDFKGAKYEPSLPCQLRIVFDVVQPVSHRPVLGPVIDIFEICVVYLSNNIPSYHLSMCDCPWDWKTGVGRGIEASMSKAVYKSSSDEQRRFKKIGLDAVNLTCALVNPSKCKTLCSTNIYWL